MNALGLEYKNSTPTCFTIPEDISSLSKLRKLDILHKTAGIVVDKFVFKGDGLSSMINDILTTQEKGEIINGQELTDDSRFPRRFQGCPFSFKFDGKSRRKHEITHNPPPVTEEAQICLSLQRSLTWKARRTQRLQMTCLITIVLY